MSNSSLVTQSIPAYTGNYTKNRAAYGKISEITIHHAAGNMTIESLGKLWQTVGRKGSSHYGVQHGQVGQYVNESDIAWTNSNWLANCRAVTIETANSGGAPDWPIADDTLNTLIKLVADIARRNGLVPLVYGKNLTWHSMYTATACPGTYLKGKLQYIVDKANEINSSAAAEPPIPSDPAQNGLFYVQVGAFKAEGNAKSYAAKAKAAGFQYIIKKEGELYKVQLEAFKERANANAFVAKVKAAGFDACVVGDAAAQTGSASTSITKGDTVKVKQGAPDYNGVKLSSSVYASVYVVRQVDGDRVVIAPKATGAVTAAVKASSLSKV